MDQENSQIIRQHNDPLEFMVVNLMKPVTVDIQPYLEAGEQSVQWILLQLWFLSNKYSEAEKSMCLDGLGR